MGVESLKLVSLNVKGISNFHKRKTIYTWCQRKNADFSLLQETHSKTEIETQWKHELGGGRDYYVTWKFKFSWSCHPDQKRR